MQGVLTQLKKYYIYKFLCNKYGYEDVEKNNFSELFGVAFFFVFKTY